MATTIRSIQASWRSVPTTEGAGVRLRRAFGFQHVPQFDPFLLFDDFHSEHPADYLAGFPWHPHRGIETITYLISGRIEHMDSLGNKGVIASGESQWMTAGSGILHQEMPQASDRMLGFQLWLNLPRKEKMVEPAYLSITPQDIPVVTSGNATIRVLSGSYGDATGVLPRHIPASIFDISLPRGESLTLPTKPEENVFVFLIEGDAIINATLISEKTAVLFGGGDSVSFSAAPERDLRIIFFSGKALHEPIAWGGPIVMNTREELDFAFDELRRGTFIKTK